LESTHRATDNKKTRNVISISDERASASEVVLCQLSGWQLRESHLRKYVLDSRDRTATLRAGWRLANDMAPSRGICSLTQNEMNQGRAVDARIGDAAVHEEISIEAGNLFRALRLFPQPEYY
jgi:hypothetical protein